MSALRHLVDQGGWVMFAILPLSVLLYARCFRLLLGLWDDRRRLRRHAARLAADAAELRRLRAGRMAEFRGERVALGAMIAAAPLLGLLGTVSGMEKTFDSLALRAGEQSMEGLAGGISEVLVATQSGLAVAIPAMLLVYVAHREVHRQLEFINRLERGGRAGGAP